MITFKKLIKNNTANFKNHTPNEQGIVEDRFNQATMYVDANDQCFEIKITDESDNIIIWHKILNSNVLTAVTDDYSLIATNVGKRSDSVDSLSVADLHYVFDETYVTRKTVRTSSPIIDCPYSIFIRDASVGLSSATIIIDTPPSDLVSYIFAGPSAADIENAQILDRERSLLPNIQLASSASVSADSVATVSVTSDSDVKEVWLEPVCGIINKTRVSLTNGQGSFKVYSTGLETGDIMRVKAGHKKVLGMTSVEVTVS